MKKQCVTSLSKRNPCIHPLFFFINHHINFIIYWNQHFSVQHFIYIQEHQQNLESRLLLDLSPLTQKNSMFSTILSSLQLQSCNYKQWKSDTYKPIQHYKFSLILVFFRPKFCLICGFDLILLQNSRGLCYIVLILLKIQSGRNLLCHRGFGDNLGKIPTTQKTQILPVRQSSLSL